MRMICFNDTGDPRETIVMTTLYCGFREQLAKTLPVNAEFERLI